ncbi:hypothetical protein P43SY_010497 [Pythium insidiosum]|uniref:Uncharacterized protein n=1 Tax=Pythium insidiosum TaxID=114742 RepID=A0AAD5Q4Z5_PYTIN|nr:hypothetical protein P43SY_010497 [Pythium insidiosum]
MWEVVKAALPEAPAEELSSVCQGSLTPYLAYASSGNLTELIVHVNHSTAQHIQWLADTNVKLEAKIAPFASAGSSSQSSAARSTC